MFIICKKDIKISEEIINSTYYFNRNEENKFSEYMLSKGLKLYFRSSEEYIMLKKELNSQVLKNTLDMVTIGFFYKTNDELSKNNLLLELKNIISTFSSINKSIHISYLELLEFVHKTCEKVINLYFEYVRISITMKYLHKLEKEEEQIIKYHEELAKGGQICKIELLQQKLDLSDLLMEIQRNKKNLELIKLKLQDYYINIDSHIIYFKPENVNIPEDIHPTYRKICHSIKPTMNFLDLTFKVKGFKKEKFNADCMVHAFFNPLKMYNYLAYNNNLEKDYIRREKSQMKQLLNDQKNVETKKKYLWKYIESLNKKNYNFNELYNSGQYSLIPLAKLNKHNIKIRLDFDLLLIEQEYIHTKIHKNKIIFNILNSI